MSVALRPRRSHAGRRLQHRQIVQGSRRNTWRCESRHSWVRPAEIELAEDQPGGGEKSYQSIVVPMVDAMGTLGSLPAIRQPPVHHCGDYALFPCSRE